MLYINQKGQEEAPFSLLLAVAMLAMVMPMSFYLLNQFQEYECQQRIANNMATFAREIELASTLGGGIRTVDVDLSSYGCVGARVDRFKMTAPPEERCVDICHDPNCRILSGLYLDYSLDPPEENIVHDVCIRIPFNIEFTSQGCELNGLTSIGEEIEPGYHKIILEKKGYKVQMCEEPPLERG